MSEADDLLQIEENGTLSDLIAGPVVNSHHGPVCGRNDSVLHFHRLEHHKRRARFDDVALSHEHFEHLAGHRCDQPTLFFCARRTGLNALPLVGATVEMNPPYVANFGGVSEAGTTVPQGEAETATPGVGVGRAMDPARPLLRP